MSEKLILTLDNIKPSDWEYVGGKALNLALLRRNNLKTASGLVVTTSFFESQINHFSYAPIWAGSLDVEVTEGALQFLANFLKATPLAPHLEQALKKKLAHVFPDSNTLFAVRSSAIDEDWHDRSFAGCYLTELAVPYDMLTISLTRCWASALTGQAIEYRHKHGMSIQGIKIAVLIQPMFTPQSGGVAFTCNPVTARHNEFVIEATTGPGNHRQRIVRYQIRLACQHCFGFDVGRQWVTAQFFQNGGI